MAPWLPAAFSAAIEAPPEKPVEEIICGPAAGAGGRGSKGVECGVPLFHDRGTSRNWILPLYTQPPKPSGSRPPCSMHGGPLAGRCHWPPWPGEAAPEVPAGARPFREGRESAKLREEALQAMKRFL
eukprot:TRINITY_DN71786_c0_g1_i1.p2 TRINITY_DN71786_c0_g1~~TRINITY_DN71786_c0_g1_i1.p2  ORF type:complete len:127 (-),score=30.40 TRINITY_DN71786_c0_g1_i1:65-445(-)